MDVVVVPGVADPRDAARGPFLPGDVVAPAGGVDDGHGLQVHGVRGTAHVDFAARPVEGDRRVLSHDLDRRLVAAVIRHESEAAVDLGRCRISPRDIAWRGSTYSYNGKYNHQHAKRGRRHGIDDAIARSRLARNL